MCGKVAIIFLLFFLGFSATAEGNCGRFRNCYDLGKEAEKNENLELAYSYYSQACPQEVRRSLLWYHYNSCTSIIRISGQLNDYSSAFQYFNQSCQKGEDRGCYYLSLLEESRGDLARAIELMKPVCKENSSFPHLNGREACKELKKMKSRWKKENKKPFVPRNTPVQLVAFFTVLLLPVGSFLLLIRYLFRGNRSLLTSILILNLLTFAVYGFYESGISPYASIRIDMLLILPALALNLVVLTITSRKTLKKKPVPPT